MTCEEYPVSHTLVLCAGLIAAQTGVCVIAQRVIRSYAPFNFSEVSKKNGETDESFVTQASINFVGAVCHSFLGPTAMYYAMVCLTSFSFEDVVYLSDAPPQHLCETVELGMLLGVGFWSYVLFQCLSLALKWEKFAWDTFFHHIIFAGLGWLSLHGHGPIALAFGAIAMETSTPPLLAMLTFRRLVGWEKLVKVSQGTFALLFFLARPFLFSIILGTHLHHYFFLMPDDYFSDEFKHRKEFHRKLYAFSLALYTVGLVLQYVWAVNIAKMMPCFAKKAKRSKDY